MHATPPTGGGSADTTIRDAGPLGAEYAAVRDGTSTMPLAPQRIQQAMSGYKPDRVCDALGVLRSMQRLWTPLASTAARVDLPGVAAWRRLQRRVTSRADAAVPVAGRVGVIS